MKNNVNIGADNKTLPKGNTTYASSDSKTYFVRDYMTGDFCHINNQPSKTPLVGEDGCYGTNYIKGCWYRLPCGLCRMTNEPCPYGGKVRYEVTC